MRHLYAVMLAAILLVAVLTPFLVERVTLVRKEYAQVVLLAVMFSAAYVIHRLYRAEARRAEMRIADLETNRRTLEERLDEAFRYIGRLNVQIHQIEAIFTNIGRYPESRQETKEILRYLSEKVLGIVNAEWVLLRIVDRAGIRTLCEHWAPRGRGETRAPNISNKDLITRTAPSMFSVIESSQDNLSLNTYCILPTTVEANQRVLIEAIANQVEMLFLIFSSRYYKQRGVPAESAAGGDNGYARSLTHGSQDG